MQQVDLSNEAAVRVAHVCIVHDSTHEMGAHNFVHKLRSEEASDQATLLHPPHSQLQLQLQQLLGMLISNGER